MKAEDINWEEAPEGTTHYSPEVEDCSECWVKYDGKDYYFKYKGSLLNWWLWGVASYYKHNFIERPKEKEMQFKAMKIRVKDEEHSRLIQEALFEIGYGWVSGSGKPEYTNKKFLYTYPNKNINWGMAEESFFSNENKEYEAKIKVEFVEIQKPDTVELNGKTYLKSDLEEALAKLNPVG